ncbi:membrane-associated protein, putative [Bodo saltans]|uniref:Membrane-associated protein, putative n=1 Tax=Bodo saltans TaxID=75058 RepID=A0A0S4IMW5_BODSA|nr:membrane-associated protein, putative [Bodo saltans]|eukprot:CUF55695.1 membrane-associated protein, putative [Bodo saltans]
MCRSRSTLLIFTVISCALVPISIIMLIVENTNDRDAYSCAPSTASIGICVPCNTLEPTYTTQATIDEYLQTNGIVPADFGWPAPPYQTDWAWFFQYICIDYASLSSTSISGAGSSSSSSSGSGSTTGSAPVATASRGNDVFAAATIIIDRPEGNVGDNEKENEELDLTKFARISRNMDELAAATNNSNRSTSSSVEACCCGTSLSTTNTLRCPISRFHVTVWSWLWFAILVFGATGVLLSILGYVFLECGCIESSKGPLEMIADDLHLRRSEGR